MVMQCIYVCIFVIVYDIYELLYKFIVAIYTVCDIMKHHFHQKLFE